jgi:hypothetical protein
MVGAGLTCAQRPGWGHGLGVAFHGGGDGNLVLSGGQAVIGNVKAIPDGRTSSLPGQLGPSWLRASGPCCAKPLIQPTPAIGCASKALSRKFRSQINFAKR